MESFVRSSDFATLTIIMKYYENKTNTGLEMTHSSPHDALAEALSPAHRTHVRELTPSVNPSSKESHPLLPPQAHIQTWQSLTEMHTHKNKIQLKQNPASGANPQVSSTTLPSPRLYTTASKQFCKFTVKVFPGLFPARTYLGGRRPVSTAIAKQS